MRKPIPPSGTRDSWHCPLGEAANAARRERRSESRDPRSRSKLSLDCIRAIFALALAALAPLAGADARQDPSKPVAPVTAFELVVFEADGCVYCQDFRTRIQPLYTASALGREAPLRYVNVSRSDETKMGLSDAITIAPTIVLMHNGQEVDRIVGYTGPGDFMKLVAHMMGRGN